MADRVMQTAAREPDHAGNPRRLRTDAEMAMEGPRVSFTTRMAVHSDTGTSGAVFYEGDETVRTSDGCLTLQINIVAINGALQHAMAHIQGLVNHSASCYATEALQHTNSPNNILNTTLMALMITTTHFRQVVPS